MERKYIKIEDQINQVFNEHISVINSLVGFSKVIEDLATRMINTFNSGGKILLIGNGGSAADAQHIAAELVGRFSRERKGLAAIALTTDSSILTSISNDYGYDLLFSRQIEAIAAAGDLVFAISTSGNSKNILKAVITARQLECKTVALLGKDGGLIKDVVDLALIVPSNSTPRIQEAHILIGHILCEIIDSVFAE